LSGIRISCCLVRRWIGDEVRSHDGLMKQGAIAI
jgi:hypothetical protein